MDGIPKNAAHLESLTTDELVRMADTHGIDIPPGLERIFIIEELLELAAYEMEMNEEYIESPPSKPPESAVLPKQYNITYLETLVRDPLWVYVFWEVKGADREVFEKAADFTGYFLKVSPWNRNAPDEIFTVPVSPEDSARYLGFPVADDKGSVRRSYKIELFAGRGAEDVFLTACSPFTLPMLSPRIDKTDKIVDSSLIQLSGIDELHILRNGDRQSRVKRCG